MANWTTDSKNVTTESSGKVTCDDGRTGRVAIEQDSPGMVKFGDVVYETEVLIEDGFPVSGKRIPIDKHPTINGIPPGGWIDQSVPPPKCILVATDPDGYTHNRSWFVADFETRQPIYQQGQSHNEGASLKACETWLANRRYSQVSTDPTLFDDYLTYVREATQ